MTVGFAVVLSVAPVAFGGPPTKETLLQAWEQAQRSDAATVAFEKVGDGRYHFRTTRFPFDGELKVLNISIEEGPGALGMAGYTGFVEVELENAPPGFAEKYARSYAFWQTTNAMFFDAGAAKWLTTKEWQAQVSRRATPPWFLVHYGTLFWILFLAALVVAFWRLSRRMTRQVETAKAVQARLLEGHEKVLRLSERSIELAEDSNRTLHGILEALRGGRST